MIFFDVTKTGAVRHRSGLARLSQRLREELAGEAHAATWIECRERVRPGDWFVTSELFSEAERPGFPEFLRSRRCRTAAIFADAIPLKLPQITWPQSVARHPGYMKLLAAFDRVWAISQASRDELCEYWRWLGLEHTPPVEVLALGADLARVPRATSRPPPAQPPALLSVGILEPRKNQMLLLDACEQLWNEGLGFELHLVGRVNPHFGRPIVARIRTMRRRYPRLNYHAAVPDEELARLYARVRAVVYPTIAEGCGLPLLEALWQGVPCVCSALPVLRENADAGGCVTVTPGDRDAWCEALRAIVSDDVLHARLTAEALRRPLPTWGACAEILRASLK